MYRTIAVDQQVYDMIKRSQERSGVRTSGDAVRLMLGMPPVSTRRTRALTIGAVKAVLGDRPDSTAADVAEAVDLSYGSATTILADLAKTGQVQRRPDPIRRRGPITYRWRLNEASLTPVTDTSEMRELVTEFRQQAVDEAAKGRDELAEKLDSDHDDLTGAIINVLYRQHYAYWWNTITNHIEDNGLAPVTALRTTRDNAQRALSGLNARTPCDPCPHTRDPALILRDATSDFCRDTEPFMRQARDETTPPTAQAATDRP